jgi:hypothetical protein
VRRRNAPHEEHDVRRKERVGAVVVEVVVPFAMDEMM